MTVPFAAYLRTSTDDHQSPDDSAAWQLRLARQLIASSDGAIEHVFHDVDQSRSLPWERRPEAALLLDAVANPGRGWKDLVIAEPQRAFAGNQFALVFPVLVHYGVDLWVPEVGGKVDPNSEAHDLLMNLFGGLAKAERNRIRHRVRAAMAAHASSGRWLGGRPPYGYTLADDGPHPNPEKAASGVRLHRLEVDDDTGSVVTRIFNLYVADGLGYKAIASRLTAEDVPSPSAHDPRRNSHRSGHAWTGSAVRAILANPRYLGRHVFGKQRRQERLIDPRQPALGHETTMAWQSTEEWVYAEDETHPALVSKETWEAAQREIARRKRSNGSGSPRSPKGRYALIGLMTCFHCGRRMQGNHARGHAFYRCRLTSGDYAAPPANHPPSLSIREDRLLPVLDGWLIDLFDPQRIDETAAAIVAADDGRNSVDPAVRRAERQIEDNKQKLKQYLAALDAGMDPALVATRTKAAQAEIEAAEVVLRRGTSPRTTLTVEVVAEQLHELRHVPELLNEADPPTRAAIYSSLDLHLAYRRCDEGEFLLVNQAVDLKRVGGGT